MVSLLRNWRGISARERLALLHIGATVFLIGIVMELIGATMRAAGLSLLDIGLASAWVTGSFAVAFVIHARQLGAEVAAEDAEKGGETD